MLLVIDIGNTSVVLGLFSGDQLERCWRIATLKARTADEYAVMCRDLFDLCGVSTADVHAVTICSVVPPLNERFELMCRNYLGLDPFFVDPVAQDLIRIHYEPVSDVGADRIVNAVAAIQTVGSPAVVVDFGTATTFDAISKRGEYLGGIIAPGIGVSAEALFTHTAKLPRVEIKKPRRVIGKSTDASLQAGIYFGYVGLVEGILENMRRELKKPQVIATGGLAPLICSELEQIDQIEENLILYGLRIFHEWHTRVPFYPRRKKKKSKRKTK